MIGKRIGPKQSSQGNMPGPNNVNTKCKKKKFHYVTRAGMEINLM